MISVRLALLSLMPVVWIVPLSPVVAQTGTATQSSATSRPQQTTATNAGRYFERCVEELDLLACKHAKKLQLSAKEKSQVLTYEFAAQSSSESKALLDEAIRLDPENALAYFSRASSGTAKVEEAVNGYQRAIKLNPEWKRYYVDVAIVADNADSYKNSEEGLKLWQLAVESAPDDPRAYAGYANALSRRGKTAEAEGIFQKALAANPSDAESAAGLCSLYIKQKNPTKLRPSCTTTIQLDSGELETLAWELGDLKEYALAESAYRKALERGFDPQHTLELNLANVLFEEGKASEAAEMYKQYVARNPHDSTYLDAYAMALESSGDIQGAEKEYLKAVEHSDCGTRSALGRFYLHQKKYQQAFEELDQAFQEQWDCPTPVYLLTHEPKAFGPEEKQIPQFEEKILARARPKPEEKIANTWYRFANLAHEFGSNDEAAIAYRKAADLSPKQAFPLGGLGWALFDTGRYQEAISAFEAAEKREPGYLKSAPEVEKRYKESLAAVKGQKP
jgi:tetratricopeptide (TPR) repeat protein